MLSYGSGTVQRFGESYIVISIDRTKEKKEMPGR